MPWPKGRPRSAETRRKLSIAGRGKQVGPDNPNWGGGRTVAADGYVLILARDHPHAMPNGYVREHRIVMERALGRILCPDEHVHHKNEDRTDNRLENLALVTPGEHQNIHHIGAKRSELTRQRISMRAKQFYSTDVGREIQRQRAIDQARQRRAGGV